MPRLRARPTKANPLIWISYLISRLKTGKVAEPVGVRAHHPWIMMSYGTYELMFERAGRLDKTLPVLASRRVAQMVGCHW